ncbi:MAG TPA: malto-oligosyltrehalose trehalohydrolase [Mycobacteriales bacterium]|nr:malto-oligosyltrehalose trehalohydrolase [Mycobacteriales bacterium]
MIDRAATVGPLGATRVGDGDWSFVVWAPAHEELSVRVYADGTQTSSALSRGAAGYFVGVLTGLGDAPDYRYVTAEGAALADPASRWQPDGVHGPSRGYDPSRFSWSDQDFSAPPLSESVIYEMHVGTFTEDGSFDAAIRHLDELVDLGVTAVEPMPVAAFPGGRNWGYDGVFPFAAQHSYGGPAGFQRFVDACHQRGLAVILDVVYNHLGPEGNVLGSFGPYFTDVYATPWGAAVNVAEAGSDEVRHYFTENALMWLRDFRIDGLRLDAIHGIVDPTASPFLRELTAAVAALSAELGRRLALIAESADNNPLVVSPASLGGLGFGGQWNDDFHHALHAVLTGERNGYYRDFGGLELLARAINDGFAYQGEYSDFRGRRHGAPSRSIASDHFVVYAQNHDQIGNRAGAERLTSLVEPAVVRLAAAAVLLSPFVPLLFMGEEYAETAPFPYFVDHGEPDLLDAVRAGRAAEFGRGGDSFDPASPETFVAARLDRSKRGSESGRAMLALYRELIERRHRHPVLTDPNIIESHAAVVDGVLTIRRRSSTTMSVVALNFSADPRPLPSDDSAGLSRRVIDSAWPGRLADASELPGYGFCLGVTNRDAG